MRMKKRIRVTVVLIALAIALIAAGFARLSSCWGARTATAFQPGWYADGTPVQVYRVTNPDGTLYGYFGAC